MVRTTRTLVAVCVAVLLATACGRQTEGELTFEGWCDLRTGLLDLAAVAEDDGVVVTWSDESAGRLGDVVYRVAHRASAGDPWTLVATVELAPDAERRYLHTGGPVTGEWTVAEDDGCDPSGDVCGPDEPCPVATTSHRDG